MNNEPKISVIVPVYNVEKYITKCINSITSQTYENVEIILINDGSSDKSGKICDVLAINNDSIKVIHQKNVGVNFARRNGFEISSGEYIAFVDADDIISKDFLKTHLELLNKTGAEISVGKTHNFYGETLSQSEIDQCQIKGLKADFTLWDSKKDILSAFITSSPPHGSMALMCMWSKVFRREILTNIDWKIANYRHGEDYFINVQTYAEARKVIYINEYCYYYRRTRNEKITLNTQSNTSPSGLTITNFEYIDALIELYQKLEEKFGLDLSNEILITRCRLYAYWLEKMIDYGRLTRAIWKSYITKRLIPSIKEFKSEKVSQYMSENLVKGASLYMDLKNKLDPILENPTIEEFLQHKILQVNQEAYKPQSFVSYKDAWVVMDRPDSATDSGYHFYKWIRDNHPEINLFYVINRDSKDVRGLQEEGFNLIYINTQQHVELLDNCIVEIYAFYTFNMCKQRTKYNSLKVYLGHGIKLNNSLNPGLSPKDYFVTTFKREYDFFKENHNDFTTIQTGLPRYGSLVADKQAVERDSIVIAPQWRRWLSKKATKGDVYFVQWSTLLQSKEIHSLSQENNIVFMIHPELERKIDLLDVPQYIKTLRYTDLGANNVQNLMRKTKLMITDFSSVAVDYAIAGSDIIYFHFDRKDYYDNHTSTKGWFDYDQDGLGPVFFSLKDLTNHLQEMGQSNTRDMNVFKQSLSHLIGDDINMLKSPSENVYQHIADYLADNS